MMCGAKETDQPILLSYPGSSPLSPIVVPHDSARRFLDAWLTDSVL